MEDQVTSETLNNDTSKDKEQPGVVADDSQFLRNELITLAEKREIKHSVRSLYQKGQSQRIREDQRRIRKKTITGNQ